MPRNNRDFPNRREQSAQRHQLRAPCHNTHYPTPTPSPNSNDKRRYRTKPWPAGIIGLCPPDTIENPIGIYRNTMGGQILIAMAFDSGKLECYRAQEGTTIGLPSISDESGSQYVRKSRFSFCRIYTPQWVYDSGATKYDIVEAQATQCASLGDGFSERNGWRLSVHLERAMTVTLL